MYIVYLLLITNKVYHKFMKTLGGPQNAVVIYRARCVNAGDEVVQWNGIRLRGLTFEEVYDIIFESKFDPQVELTVYRPVGNARRNDAAAAAAADCLTEGRSLAGTSCLRSTTSNNRSCTSQWRSGTFLLGSITVLGRINCNVVLRSYFVTCICPCLV